MIEKLVTLMAYLLAAQPENTPLDDLMGGDWWKAITEVFTSSIGELFFATCFLVGPALLCIKHQDVVTPAMAILAVGAVLAMLFTSPIRFFFATMAIIGLAVVLWSVAHR